MTGALRCRCGSPSCPQHDRTPDPFEQAMSSITMAVGVLARLRDLDGEQRSRLDLQVARLVAAAGEPT